jgi:hypothetical protein
MMLFPASGVEEILNTGIANTLAGNDIIIGTKEITTDTPFSNLAAFPTPARSILLMVTT